MTMALDSTRWTWLARYALAAFVACALLAATQVSHRSSHAVPRVRSSLRGTMQKWDWDANLKTAAADVLHEAASTAVAFGIEEEDIGAPAATINTTASGQHLVQELLSNKRLTKEVRLKPTQGGLIQQGRIYDIYMKAATVGDTTRVRVGEDGEVRFVVTDLSVEVQCRYDLRLTTMDFGETGSVTARLLGTGMTLRFPQESAGPGGCNFDKGLDLLIIDATSDRSAINAAIDKILRQNLMGIRSEIVQDMEDGLCRALLEPDSVAMVGSSAEMPMAPPESMWPLVIGGVLALMVLMGACFFLGRYSAHADCCSRHRYRKRAVGLHEDEDSSSEESSCAHGSRRASREIALHPAEIGHCASIASAKLPLANQGGVQYAPLVSQHSRATILGPMPMHAGPAILSAQPFPRVAVPPI
ncbi:unnamed protein product [Effrenium voratum]|nr:unnamed protein product [Effrenium voratum]